jgi:hypothetical protein
MAKTEAEYPRWVYPPDGGPGCVAQTPDDKPKGWLEAPTEPGPATGQRVIGAPEFPATPTPPADDDDEAKKSKKK